MRMRNIFRNSVLLGIFLLGILVISCKQDKKKEADSMEVEEEVMAEQTPFFDISLAQWSIHRMIREGDTDPYDFAKMAKEWGFTGLEYVSQLYNPELSDANYSEEAMAAFVARSNEEAEKHGMKNLLIMIDGQGNLAVSDEKERNEAVERHYKWVDAAAAMGCHAIRVNLAGSDVPEEWRANSIDGLTKLATYAKDKNINIIVENHGGLSSNAAMVADVMNAVNLPNCGTLPDFGNFCIKRKDPKDYQAGCAENYDIYKGVTELMPHAKAVSAKSHNFDENGNEREIDYVKMLQIVKDAGYKGFIGVEYEGGEIGEEEGIIATKELLLNAAKKLN